VFIGRRASRAWEHSCSGREARQRQGHESSFSRCTRARDRERCGVCGGVGHAADPRVVGRPRGFWFTANPHCRGVFLALEQFN
jgi:hypothetical protein